MNRVKKTFFLVWCYLFIFLTMGVMQWTGHVWCLDRDGRFEMQHVPCCLDSSHVIEFSGSVETIPRLVDGQCVGCRDIVDPFWGRKSTQNGASWNIKRLPFHGPAIIFLLFSTAKEPQKELSTFSTNPTKELRILLETTVLII